MSRLVFAVLILFPTIATAQPKQEPLVEQVRAAIDRGVRYLRRVEKGNGHWESDQLAMIYPGGQSTLAMLALLNSGVPPTDPIILRGLEYLRSVEPRHVYVVGLQTMVFAEAGDPRDR